MGKGEAGRTGRSSSHAKQFGKGCDNPQAALPFLRLLGTLSSSLFVFLLFAFFLLLFLFCCFFIIVFEAVFHFLEF